LTVIGGAGFLGRTLVAHLAADPDFAGVQVRCLDRVDFPQDAAAPPDLGRFVGDARDPDLLRAALHGADAVWIRAALLGGASSADPGQLDRYLDGNVGLVGDVLSAADAVGCRRVFFDSSEQVFGDSADLHAQTPYDEPAAGNYYGATKLIAEKLLRLWAFEAPGDGRSAQILRYSRVRAAGSRDVIRVMLGLALAGQPLRVQRNGTSRIAFVHVDDVTAAGVAALARRPAFAVYQVGADRPLSLLEIAQRAREAAHAVTGRWSPIEVAAGAEPWEPHVVGMEWEQSRRELGLRPPIGIDAMIQETLVDLGAREPVAG
jgi:nucleoside-diphosphate-sugar epimerase